MGLPKSGLELFIGKLTAYQATEDTFNPWRDYDPIYDGGLKAPQIRGQHLRAYLSPRLAAAKYIFVAEAVGYQGAKFSGVPLVSERILLGNQKGVENRQILPGLMPRRTSNSQTAPAKTVQQLGYAEPTATIIWDTLQKLGLSPLRIIFWNIFPFHPFQKEKGPLSNRTPRAGELALGKKYLRELQGLCPHGVQTIAIGKKAAATLGEASLEVRHPANGGAKLFRKQLPQLVS